MNRQPLISVILAVYNGESTVEKAIRSVISQTYSNLELIIINDGSTDRTLELIESFIDARIKLFSQDNTGVSGARNKALSLMKGSYFCFLDADDTMPVDSLSSRIEKFLSDSSVAFVDGVVEERLLNSGKRIRSFKPSFEGNPFKELLMLNDSCFCGQTWMIKRDNNFEYKFNTRLTHGEDLDFFIKCSQSGGKYSFVNDVILVYNRHSESAMSNIDGLRAFYRYHLEQLQKYVLEGLFLHSQKALVTKKIRKILVKSYLKSGRLIKAISVIKKV